MTQHSGTVITPGSVVHLNGAADGLAALIDGGTVGGSADGRGELWRGGNARKSDNIKWQLKRGNYSP